MEVHDQNKYTVRILKLAKKAEEFMLVNRTVVPKDMQLCSLKSSSSTKSAQPQLMATALRMLPDGVSLGEAVLCADLRPRAATVTVPT